MTKVNILVVDDEEDILELVRHNLARSGYGVACAASGGTAIQVARVNLPDLVILDLMLPGLDGFEVCSLLKNDPKTRHIPIIMLTAKGEESDVIRGLELGADDYITKPFAPKVLVARVNAMLRRKTRGETDKNATIQFGDLVIHPGRHEAIVAGKPVVLTTTEFRLLHFLARRPGWVFTRSQIVDAVRGQDYAVTDRAVDVQIVGLRRKLGECGEYIETVRGVGYRMRDTPRAT